MITPNQEHAHPHDFGLAPCRGLTKREWYAGLAMMGLMPHAIAHFSSHELADRAFEIADAMIYRIQINELEAK